MSRETIGKAVTTQFFSQPDSWIQLKQRWSGVFRDKEQRKRLTSAHYLFYQAVRGKKLRPSFTGETGYQKARNDLSRVTVQLDILALFDGLLTPDAVKKVVRILQPSIYEYSPEILG